MKKQQGFTLIELLLVIAIIGILSAVLVPNLLNARRNAEDASSQLYTKNISQWVSAWLWAEEDRVVADLESDCTHANYQAEGAPAIFPTSVSSCEVSINAADSSKFSIIVTSQSGKITTLSH